MIWAVYIVGGLATLIAIAALIGSRVPRDHVASRSATFARPPADVWHAITDLASQAAWRRGVERIELISPTRFKEHARHGAIEYAIDEELAPSRRVTRIADDSLPFGGRWIYELVAEGSGTRLTITEEGFIKNVIFRFMSVTVFSTTKTLETFLADLGRHLGG